MAKSILKTKLAEVLNINRSTISFLADDIENDEGELHISEGGNNLLLLNYTVNQYCCGIIDLGDTVLGNSLFNLPLNRDEIITDCMNQVHKMLKRKVDEGEVLRKGLLTYTNVENHPISLALKSEYNNEEMPWKLVSTFHNPNSNNVVNLFIASLN